MLISYLRNFNPLELALIGGVFAWLVTASGAGMVFVFNKINRNIYNGLLGFSSGIMIAASIWSLIIPALNIATDSGSKTPWLHPALGIITGMLVLLCIDKILPHLHQNLTLDKTEGIKTKWKRNLLLLSAITLHNFPEGLVIGVGFGSLQYATSGISLQGAIALTLGIAIQDFPEGIASSIPLRTSGWSRKKSFFYGQLSGIVEPIGAIFGYLFVTLTRSILPFALSFAAGAMLFVVIEELIPESQQEGNTDISTVFTIIGFVIMMILDVALG